MVWLGCELVFLIQKYIFLYHTYHCPYKFYSSTCSLLLDSACSNLPSKSWPITFLKCQSARSLLNDQWLPSVYKKVKHSVTATEALYNLSSRYFPASCLTTPFHVPHLLRKTCSLAILYIGYINHEPVR